MLELDFNLDPAMVFFLRGNLQGIFESLQEKGQARGYMPEEADDQEFWVDGLRDENLEALEALLHLVKTDSFGLKSIAIEMEDIFAVLRACSCLRLHLRSAALRRLTDEALEAATFDMHGLRGGEHDAFGVYMLLAHLQSVILDALD